MRSYTQLYAADAATRSYPWPCAAYRSNLQECMKNQAHQENKIKITSFFLTTTISRTTSIMDHSSISFLDWDIPWQPFFNDLVKEPLPDLPCIDPALLTIQPDLPPEKTILKITQHDIKQYSKDGWSIRYRVYYTDGSYNHLEHNKIEEEQLKQYWKNHKLTPTSAKQLSKWPAYPVDNELFKLITTGP